MGSNPHKHPLGLPQVPPWGCSPPPRAFQALGGGPLGFGPPIPSYGSVIIPPRTLVAVGDVVAGLGVEEEGGQAERLVALVAQADIVVA